MVFSRSTPKKVITAAAVVLSFAQTGCLIRGQSPDLTLKGSYAESSETVALNSPFLSHQRDVAKTFEQRPATIAATKESGESQQYYPAPNYDDSPETAEVGDDEIPNSAQAELNKATAEAIGDFGGIPVIWPVETGKISSHFGLRKNRLHAGLDISAPRGTPVRASADGQVIIARRQGAYGKLVIIEHASDRQTVYSHLDTFAVTEGDIVKAGEFIGRVGRTGRATGAHLHFETRIANGVPRDPLAFLPRVTTILPKVSLKDSRRGKF
jgi:murein DD-endopeptidase MepM/ murein hydrolase activator NlpD